MTTPVSYKGENKPTQKIANLRKIIIAKKRATEILDEKIISLENELNKYKKQ